MNWYKTAISKSIEFEDIFDVSNNQWQEISDRMVELGYDFRGGKDTKEIFEKILERSGEIKESIYQDHYNVFKDVVGFSLEGEELASRTHLDRAINGFSDAYGDYYVFGITDDFREAGYMIPDGRMLDFSGKSEGGLAGTRSYDHRQINIVFDESFEKSYEPMIQFMKEGNIRIVNDALDILVLPTENQFKTIAKFVKYYNGNVRISIGENDEIYKDFPIGTNPIFVINWIKKQF